MLVLGSVYFFKNFGGARMDDNGAVDRAAGLQARKPRFCFDVTQQSGYFPDTSFFPIFGRSHVHSSWLAR